MPNQFTNQDAVLDAAIALRQADLEAYRQRLIAADSDPTNYSLDYTERDGIDSDGDGLIWDTEKSQWLPVVAATAGASAEAVARIDYTDGSAPYELAGAGNNTLSYFDGFLAQTVAYNDYAVSLDSWNGDYGFNITESGIVRISFGGTLRRRDGLSGDFTGGYSTLYIYGNNNVNGITSQKPFYRSAGLSTFLLSMNDTIEVFVDPALWILEPGQPSSTQNVMFGFSCTAPSLASRMAFSKLTMSIVFVPTVAE